MSLYGPNAYVLNRREEQQNSDEPKFSGSLQGAKGRVTINSDGTTEYQSLKNVQASASVPVDPNAGILASARTSYGRIPSELNDDTLVTVGGIQTTLGAAVAMGFVQKINGNYVEPGVTQESEAQEEAQSETSTAPNPELLLDQTSEAIIENIYQEAGPDVAERVVSQIIFGHDREVSINKMASVLGKEPDEFSSEVNSVITSFETMSANWMSRHCGVDGKAAIEWAREELDPRSINEVSYRVFRGDMRGLEALAKEFKRSTERS